MTIGNTSLTGGGNVSFGFAESSGAGNSSNNVNLGFSGDVKGYYFNPSFLHFNIDPYYNQSRLNSTFNSISGGKGFSASMGLFSGSNMPLEINFNKDYNHESQFGIPGSPNGFISEGNSQSFNANWNLRLKDKWPSLSIAFGTGSGSSQLVGTNSTGSGSSKVFSIGANYNVLGFSLNGTFTKSHTVQEQPLITDVTKNLEQAANQSTEQISATRPLTRWANFTANASRSSFREDLTGGNPSTNSFESASGTVALTPSSKLRVNLTANYTTNLSAMFLGSLLPGNGNPQQPIWFPPLGTGGATTTGAGGTTTTGTGSTTGTGTGGTTETLLDPLSSNSSQYTSFGTGANYRFNNSLNANFTAQHMVQEFKGGVPSTSNSESGGLGYGHRYFGGQFSAHGNLMEFSFSGSAHSSAMGYSGGAGYTHSLGQWNNSVDVQYSRATATSALSTLTNGYGFGVNTGRRMGPWLLNLSARMNKNSLAAFSNTDTTSTSYSASIGGQRYAFAGNYSKNNGISIETPTGLQPISVPGELFLPNLIVLYGGSAYSFSGSYHPNRRLSLVGDYVHSQYNTSSNGALSQNMLRQLDVKSEYQLRLLSISAGFSQITQMLGVVAGKSPTINSFYVGISRHFDFF